jgi:hypothetical protein
MGAWDCGPFDNDDAGDFIDQLATAEDTEPLETALQAALEESEYVEADTGSAAIAAAAVIAGAAAEQIDDLPEVVQDYITRIELSPDQALIDQAQDVVELILDHSELKELWEEAEDDYAKWEKSLRHLIAQLNEAE